MANETPVPAAPPKKYSNGKLALMVFGSYLLISLVASTLLMSRCRAELRAPLAVVGKDAFRDTAKLAKDLETYSPRHRYGIIFKCLVPFGWQAEKRIRDKEEMIVYGSRNYALPVADRFKNPDEAKKHGFDPAKKSDDELARQVMANL